MVKTLKLHVLVGVLVSMENMLDVMWWRPLETNICPKKEK
jgi:hypothetical protein